MTEPQQQMSEETRDFLGDLTRDDIATIKAGLPIIKAVLGFGKVSKWIAITSVGLLAGVVLLGESVMKIVGWFWPPPPVH